MKTKKSFLQKTIIISMLIIISLSILMPTVNAMILPEDGKGLVDQNGHILEEEGVHHLEKPSNGVSNGYYYTYTGEDGNKHIVPLKQLETPGASSGETYSLQIDYGTMEWNNDLGDYAEAIEKINNATGGTGTLTWVNPNADPNDPNVTGTPGEVQGTTEELAVSTKEEDSQLYYEDDDDGWGGLGGILLSPIVDLFCSVGDVVINALQWAMTGDFHGGEIESNGYKNWSMSMFLANSNDYKGWNESTPQEKSIGSDTTAEINVNPEKFDKGWLNLKKDYYIPVAIYSPEEIFANRVPGLDVNFIHPKYDASVGGSAGKLHELVAGWYLALRNFAIVGLLSVLVYVGIRIIISSSAGDKAKYKQMMADWLIALCLLFFMHYIMSFTLSMTSAVTDAIAGGVDDGGKYTPVQSITVNIEGGKSFNTNLLGAARFQTQYKNIGPKLAYLIMYLALVIYTVIFTWFYLKRVLMMAFLTIIAPLVSLTYPIDKMNDGKAQAFDSWLKEYVFNALIQPFHLIIYMVFVGSALDLAKSNIIYTVAALGFILPAETILRKFFGFNKAGAGTLGSIVGGAAIGSYLQKGIKNFGGGGSSDKGKGGSKDSAPEGDKPIKFERGPDFSGIQASDDDLSNIGGMNAKSGASPLASPNDNNSQGEVENPFSSLYEQNDEDAREVYGQGMPYSREEYEEMLGEHGMSDQQIANQIGENNTSPRVVTDDESVEGETPTTNRAGTSTTTSRASTATSGLTDKQKALNGRRYLRQGMAKKYQKLREGLTLERAEKAIRKGVKKGGKMAFSAATGTLVGLVSAASGGGMTGAMAGFTAGSVASAKLYDNATKNIGEGAISTAWGNWQDARNGNNDNKNKRELSAKMRDSGNLEYVRTKMIKEGWTDSNGQVHSKGEIPSMKDIDGEMKNYKPYLKENMNMRDASKARATAERLGISDEQVAKIISLGNKMGVDKATLDKEESREQFFENIREEFIKAGKSERVADSTTQRTADVLLDFYGTAAKLRRRQEARERYQNGRRVTGEQGNRN